MAEEFENLNVAPDPQNQSWIGMPQILWSLEPCSDSDSTRLMDMAFKRWKAAHRSGFRIRNVIYRGKPLTVRQVELCNHLLESGTFGEAVTLHHWDAVRLFERLVVAAEKPERGLGVNHPQ